MAIQISDDFGTCSICNEPAKGLVRYETVDSINIWLCQDCIKKGAKLFNAPPKPTPAKMIEQARPSMVLKVRPKTWEFAERVVFIRYMDEDHELGIEDTLSLEEVKKVADWLNKWIAKQKKEEA